MAKVFGAMSAIDFAVHFAEVAAKLETGLTETMDKAAEIVQKEAKEILGNYQEGIGPFGSWPELASSTQSQRENQGFNPNEPLLRDGTLRKNIERSAEMFESQVGVPSKLVSHSYDKRTVDIGDVAIWQELGTSDGKIPPRPFLGIAALKKADEVEAIIGGGFLLELLPPKRIIK